MHWIGFSTLCFFSRMSARFIIWWWKINDGEKKWNCDIIHIFQALFFSLQRCFKGFISFMGEPANPTPRHHHHLVPPDVSLNYESSAISLSYTENVSSVDFIIFMTSFSCLIWHAENFRFLSLLCASFPGAHSFITAKIRHAYFHERGGGKSIFATFFSPLPCFTRII